MMDGEELVDQDGLGWDSANSRSFCPQEELKEEAPW